MIEAKRFYSPAEDALIVGMWPSHKIKDIAGVLERDDASISERAKKLGLPSKAIRSITFTEEQAETMVAMRPNHTLKQIADHLGVSIFPVQQFFFKLRDPWRALPQRVETRKPKKEPYILAPMEFAPGHFAVDVRSYELITGRTP
jgi:hypothetical protein